MTANDNWLDSDPNSEDGRGELDAPRATKPRPGKKPQLKKERVRITGAVCSRFNSAVFEAAACGNADELVSTMYHYRGLIDATNPQQFDRTPMHAAALGGHVEVVATLHRLGSQALDRPDRFGSTPMHLAASFGHSSLVETLCRLGSTALDQPDGRGSTPMHAAARRGCAEVLWTLCKLGSAALDRPNSLGETPMHLAVAASSAIAVETLIRLGSKTHERHGTEFLRSMFKRKRADVAELLLAAGVDVAALADEFPQQVHTMLATPAERLLALRYRLYFSSRLLDVLLR